MTPPLLLRLNADLAAATSVVADSTSGADPSSQLVQYGVLGLIAAVLGPFAYSTYKWQVRRGDLLQERNDALTTLYTDKILPAVLTSTEAVTASQTVLRDIAPVLVEIKMLLQTQQRER